MNIAYITLGLVLGGIGVWLWLKGKSGKEIAVLEMQVEDLDRIRNEIAQKNSELSALQANHAALQATSDKDREVFEEKLEFLEHAREKLTKDFENVANKIFDDKSAKSKSGLNEVLQPFKEQMESFRNRVDEVHKDDTARSAQLFEQVKHLQETSNKVSNDAQNLATAIKGDSKAQGDWGEIIVERVFEMSGLEEGRDFEKQASLRDDDGALKRPDFIVKLPEDKAIIVDSKVSLKAYEQFVNAESPEAQEVAIAEHLKSVRKHVKELQEKKYDDLLGNKTLDFVLMCIPIEPAYQAALQHDEELMYSTGKIPVVITGPTNLIITLKLIAQIWRREHENRNVEKIADRAGRMYDQVALIVEAMEEAEKKLTGVSGSFETAMKRLKTGRGNLVGRAEEIRKLGAKVNKQLAPETVERALMAGENDTEEI